MNRISFKVYFGSDNIRRFTNDSIPSFQEFQSIITKLSPTQVRRIQYKDAEGDLITIASELEWEEMFSQFPDEKLYKLYLSEPSIEKEECPSFKPFYCRRPCRRGAFLPYGLQRRGLNLLFEKQYNEASLIFRTQCTLQPDNPIPFYNVACSESLMGNIEIALEYLEKAIHLGYNDLEHMLKDEDLVNIRHTDQFKMFCDRLRNETQKPKPDPTKPQNPSPIISVNESPKPTTEPQPEPIPEPPKPTTEPKPEHYTSPNANKQPEPLYIPEPPISIETPKPSPFASQLDIMHEMGYYNDELILSLLQKYQGDLQKTLKVLIGE